MLLCLASNKSLSFNTKVCLANSTFLLYLSVTINSVPQGSVLGPLLFNIFTSDLFFLVEETEVCIYEDDTTIYLRGQELEHAASSLENDAQRISNWLFDNSMKLNPDKCHLLTFGGNNVDVSVHIGETVVTEPVKEKLLGVTLETRTLILRVMLLQHVKKLGKSCLHLHLFQVA